MSTKTYTENPDKQIKMNGKREKKYIQSDQPALKERRSLNYTKITKKFPF
jgi:hypothetical protein